jgi:hypothetical protein
MEGRELIARSDVKDTSGIFQRKPARIVFGLVL